MAAVLTSVACVARGIPALGALDHVCCIISDFLDVSVSFSLPRAASTGSVELFQRSSPCPVVNPALQFHLLGKAMEAAITDGRISIVQRIHSVHPDPLSVRSFQVAIENGHLDILQWLCEHRFDSLCVDTPPAQQANRSLLCCFDIELLGDGNTARHFQVLRWLYDHGYVQSVGMTPTRAASVGDLEMVKWLHEREPDAFTFSVMDAAVANGHLPNVKFLYGNGVQSCSPGVYMRAIVSGHEAVVTYLEQQSICSIINPETMLLLAASHARIDILEEYVFFMDDDASRRDVLEAATD